MLSSTFKNFPAVTSVQDPVTFFEAVNEGKWCKETNLELRALEENRVCDISGLPPYRKVIDCKWMYKTKFHTNASIDKHKARLLVLGYKQKEDINDRETLAPVAMMTTMRPLLLVTSMKG